LPKEVEKAGGKIISEPEEFGKAIFRAWREYRNYLSTELSVVC
jgi:hypothetical protein